MLLTFCPHFIAVPFIKLFTERPFSASLRRIKYLLNSLTPGFLKTPASRLKMNILSGR